MQFIISLGREKDECVLCLKMTLVGIFACVAFALQQYDGRCISLNDKLKKTKISLLHLSESKSATNDNYRKSSSSSSNMDEESGKCKFGLKSYWDDMYNGIGDRSADSYCWYCGWYELAPFWKELVPDKSTHVLIAGMGNDKTPIHLYDDGWNQMTAFDYSQAGIDRAKHLFGPHRMSSSSSRSVTLFHADARNLFMIKDESMGAILDKGTLDAIYITSIDAFQQAVQEFTRVTKKDAILVCISNVIPSQLLLQTLNDETKWEGIHNGELAFAPDGEATIDLGANLYSWRRL